MRSIKEIEDEIDAVNQRLGDLKAERHDAYVAKWGLTQDSVLREVSAYAKKVRKGRFHRLDHISGFGRPSVWVIPARKDGGDGEAIRFWDWEIDL